MVKKLTVKQQRFVDCYDGNATEAARQAGYKGNDVTLGQVGAENLKKPQIKEAIVAREIEWRNKAIMKREERQTFWSKVARGEEEGMTGEAVRLRASEILGKSQADFTEKHEHGVTGKINISVETVDYDK